MGHPRPLFRLFSVFFKQTIQFLQQINVKNVKSIKYLATGFKPTPLERESPPITTRPGLPPPVFVYFQFYVSKINDRQIIVSVNQLIKWNYEKA